MRARWLAPAVLYALFLGVPWPAWGQPKQPVTLTSTQGSTRVQHPGAGQPEEAVRKLAVKPGDTIRTGPGSGASLLFADGTQVTLNANTALRIPESLPRSGVPALDHGIPARLDLLAGELFARITPGRRLSITTPVAVAGVRGTELNLKLTEAATTSTLTVAEGQVEFSNPSGQVLVQEGQQSTARQGEKPTPPVTAVNLPLIIQWKDDVQPAALLLEISYISQDPARLTAALKEAEKLPEGPERRQRRGDVRHDQGELRPALDDYQAALDQLGPNAPNAQRALLEARRGQTLLEMGKLPEAEAAFRTSLELDPAGTAARTGLVMALLSQLRTPDALAAARAAVQQALGSPQAHTALALAQIRSGQQQAAMQELSTALQLEPGYAPAHAWRSFVLRAEERLAEAEESARRAVTLAPFSSLAHQSLSDAEFALGQIREARGEAERAVALNPLSPGAHVSLGRIMLQQGNVHRALQEANQAVALDPELNRARFFRGIVLAEQRRFERAERELKQAVSQEPDNLEARAFLARVYLQQGRSSEADAMLRETMARNEQFAPALAAFGAMYRGQGKLKQAAAQYEAALKLDANSMPYHLELARVYLDQNRLPDALEQGLAAVGEAPRSGEAHALLGLVYDRMDNLEQALREYREALSLAPDNALARFGFGLAILRGSTEGTLLQSAEAALQEPLTDGLREIIQAALEDPSVFAQEFKPGVTTEVMPGGGDNDDRLLGLTHRDQYWRGKLYDLSFANRERSDNYRNGRPETGTLITPSLTAEPNYRTHILANAIYSGRKIALPGAVFNPDPDDRFSNFLRVLDLSTRLQVSPTTFAWFYAAQTWVQLGGENPDAPADGGLLASGQSRSRQLYLEGRLDHRWNSAGRHSTSYTLSGGRQWSNEQGRQYTPLSAVFQDIGQVTRVFRLDQTLQHEYRPGSQFLLTLGLTDQRYVVTNHGQFGQLGEQRLPGTDDMKWLPFAQATYLLSRRDLIRAIAHRRRDLQFDFILQPSEAFLVGEAPSAIQPGQITNRIVSFTNYELDYEHRFSPRTFGKLFLFRTDVDNQPVLPDVIQSADALSLFNPIGINVPKARMDGVGLRFERQLTPFLSSYLRLTYSDLTDQTDGPTRGRQLPMNPHSRATLGLNYIDRAGTKLFAEVAWRGAMFVDPFWSGHEGFDPLAPRPTFPSRFVVNLRLGREPTVHREWVLQINNAFNTKTIYWPGYPAPGRTFGLAYRVRF